MMGSHDFQALLIPNHFENTAQQTVVSIICLQVILTYHDQYYNINNNNYYYCTYVIYDSIIVSI